jgi:tRNA(Ile)-lysidine synthase
MRILHEFVDNESTFAFFCAEMDRLIEFYGKESIASVCVAVSGGSDSMSLLALTATWAEKMHILVRCVTVDHKLRSESTQEAEFVRDFCNILGVSHEILPWNKDQDAIALSKLENLAREARYRLISEFCENNDIPILLVGHTWNDQLETFEMRKHAGSSSCGLACMSQIRSLTERIKLFRPILHFTKSHLEDFLKNRNIPWKIDPMNSQDFFLRVFYRKKITQYDAAKISAISYDIIHFGKIRNGIETEAVYFLERFCEFTKCRHAVIEKNLLLLEKKAVQAEIFRRVIWNVGGKKYAKTINESLCDQILDKKINTLGGCLLKIKKDKILVFKENRPNFGEQKCGLSCAWQNHRMASETVENNLLHSNKINIFDVFL